MVRRDIRTIRCEVEDMVLQTVDNTLGQKYIARASRPLTPHGSESHLQIYHMLTNILPFSPHTEFWWNKLGRPFGSMLDTSNYSLQAQCRFLCFFYHSIIGFMPPHDSPRSGSVMTIDGSPVELSWVLPQTRDGAGSTTVSPHSVRQRRQVRFAIEPMHPVSGKLLKGSAVLDYLTSPYGGNLGMVATADDCMAWRKKTESFLFPGTEDDHEIPDGSRFFVGFDFNTDGTVSLRAYYLPAPSPSYPVQDTMQKHSSLGLYDINYDPLRRLVSELDPALMEPLELLLSYFESLDDRHKPRVQILAVDCVTSGQNRLKVYCRPKEGSSWSDAVRSFTLGGRLCSSEMDAAVGHMKRLWDNVFPQAPSDVDCDLYLPAALHSDSDSNGLIDANGIKLNEASHPVGGLLYYYSICAGRDSVFPKIYLPVTQYCRDDLAIARAVERFYDEMDNGNDETGNGKMKIAPTDWVANEVAAAMNHRRLDKKTGIHTYVTFAVKKKGWELTNYFSPEI